MSAERKLVVSSSFSSGRAHRASPARVLFSRRQKRLSTKGGKTELQGRRPWASKKEPMSSIERAALLSPNFCARQNNRKKKKRSFRRRRRWKETTTTLLLFFFLDGVAPLSTKSKANTNTDDDNEREREKERNNAFWRLDFFFCPFFFVSLL